MQDGADRNEAIGEVPARAMRPASMCLKACLAITFTALLVIGAASCGGKRGPEGAPAELGVIVFPGLVDGLSGYYTIRPDGSGLTALQGELVDGFQACWVKTPAFRRAEISSPIRARFINGPSTTMWCMSRWQTLECPLRSASRTPGRTLLPVAVARREATRARNRTQPQRRSQRISGRSLLPAAGCQAAGYDRRSRAEHVVARTADRLPLWIAPGSTRRPRRPVRHWSERNGAAPDCARLLSSWSPDGTRIAFVTGAETSTSLRLWEESANAPSPKERTQRGLPMGIISRSCAGRYVVSKKKESGYCGRKIFVGDPKDGRAYAIGPTLFNYGERLPLSWWPSAP